MADLPTWALALVAAVEHYEDVHPKVNDPTDPDECFATVLGAIPAEVRAEARGYARAKREATDG